MKRFAAALLASTALALPVYGQTVADSVKAAIGTSGFGLYSFGGVTGLGYFDGTSSKPKSVPLPYLPANGTARTLNGKLGDVASVTDFGGIASIAAATCSTAAGSASLTCSGGDFALGQGVRLDHAGAPYTGTAPTIGTAVPCGGTPPQACATGGSTSYSYQVVAMDGQGGYSAASAVATTATGAATLSIANYNTLTWAAPSSGAPGGYAIFGTRNGSFALLRFVNGATTSWNDYGAAAITPPSWLPSTPPSVPASSWLLTTINGGTAAAPLLAAAAGSTVANGTLVHDNTPNFNQALASAKTVEVPDGTFPSSGNIKMATGNVLRGRSLASSRILFNTSLVGPNQAPGINGNNTTGAEMRDLTLDPGGFSGFQPLLECINCTKPRFHDYAITDLSLFGVYIASTTNPKMWNAYITRIASSGEYNQCINTTKNGSVATTDIEFDQIHCDGSALDVLAQGGSITNSRIVRFGFGGGITTEVDPLSSGIRKTGNYVNSGVTTADTNATLPEGLEVYDAGGVVADNVLTNNPGGGLALGAKNTAVHGNVLFDNAGAGITCRMTNSTANCGGSVITGNRAYSTGTGQFTQTCGYNEYATISPPDTLAIVQDNDFDGSPSGTASSACPLAGKTFLPLQGSYAVNTTVGANGLYGNNVTVLYAKVGQQVVVTFTPASGASAKGLVNLFGEVVGDNNLQIWGVNGSGSSVTLNGTISAVVSWPRVN